MSNINRPTQTAQASFFGNTANPAPQHEIIGTEDLAVVKLASLVGIAAQSLLRICAMGELDFVAWRELLNQRLTVLGHSVSEEEIEWLEEHLPYEPTLKACIRAARQNLNDRLRSEPALPARATISLFMHGGIEEDVVTFRADELGTPTAAIILQEPLHFLCHRGAIYQFDECQVEAQLSVDLLPGGLGTPSLERERFVLQSESDFSCINGIVSLRYPSLNKVFPGIFSRLHLIQGKQNTGRSIYYHTAWKTRDSKGLTEYRSLWSIRDLVRQRKWQCPNSVAL